MSSFVAIAELGVPVSPPTPSALSLPFWEAAAEGRLQLLRCTDCLRLAAYPREICPHCWSTDRSWTEVSGRGEVQTFTSVHRAGNAGWQSVTPYVVGLVRLEEGPVLLTQFSDDADALHEGAPCEVVFTRVGAWTLPFFRRTT